MNSFVPSGRKALHLPAKWCRGPRSSSGIYAGSLDDTPEHQGEKQILKTGYGASYVPSLDGGAGRLLFLRDGSLMAQTFDPARLELLGSPSVVAERVGAVFETGYFSATENTLIYRSTALGRENQLMWLDRQGKGVGRTAVTGYVSAPRISNDGTRVGLLKEALPTPAEEPIFAVLDISRDTSSRLTFGPGAATGPVWSPDGHEIAYASVQDGVFNLYRKPAVARTRRIVGQIK